MPFFRTFYVGYTKYLSLRKTALKIHGSHCLDLKCPLSPSPPKINILQERESISKISTISYILTINNIVFKMTFSHS